MKGRSCESWLILRSSTKAIDEGSVHLLLELLHQVADSLLRFVYPLFVNTKKSSILTLIQELS